MAESKQPAVWHFAQSVSRISHTRENQNKPCRPRLVADGPHLFDFLLARLSSINIGVPPTNQLINCIFFPPHLVFAESHFHQLNWIRLFLISMYEYPMCAFTRLHFCYCRCRLSDLSSGGHLNFFLFFTTEFLLRQRYELIFSSQSTKLHPCFRLCPIWNHGINSITKVETLIIYWISEKQF